MSSIKVHLFRGKKYFIKWIDKKKFGGKCDPPDKKKKKTSFGIYLKGENELRIFLHEPLHSVLWDLDEKAVNEISLDLARWLWRLGYRRVNCE